MTDERGASKDFQQDRAEAEARTITLRKDRELERMIEALPMPLTLSAALEYRDEVLAIVRRHNADLLADLGRKRVLIEHLEGLLAERRP